MKKILLLLIVFSFAKISYAQDPARTPKNPSSSDPVTTVDGSTGKYRNKHHHPNGHNWARRRKHADTVKPSHGKEATKPKSKEKSKANEKPESKG